jgi:hypothetical protein
MIGFEIAPEHRDRKAVAIGVVARRLWPAAFDANRRENREEGDHTGDEADGCGVHQAVAE